jgi:hypothetical protein
MRIIPILCLALLFSPVLLIAQDAGGAPWTYKRVGNKIYNSIFDENMYMVAPDNNDTIARYCTYGIFFICTNSKNLSIRYNDTTLQFKKPNERAVMCRFYANDSQFNINVIETNNQSVEYIKIHYNAKGGIIILPPWTPDIPGEIPTFTPFGFTIDDMMSIASKTVFLGALILIVLGLTIKFYKESKTVERRVKPGMTYYRRE